MACGVGRVHVQLPELHQHLVAVVVGHEVAEGPEVALQGGVEPVAGGALDVDLAGGRPAALGGHPVPGLPVAHTVFAEDAVYGHPEAHGVEVAVALAQHVARFGAQAAATAVSCSPLHPAIVEGNVRSARTPSIS